MSDPREIGLPPREGAPAFSVGQNALTEVRRRHTRRRRRRMTAVGGALAAAAVAVALTLSPGATNGALEQEQPAGHVPSATARPSARPLQPSPTPNAARNTRASASTSTPNSTAPRPGPTPAPPANSSAQGSGQQPRQSGTADSTPVTRDRTTLGQETCRGPLNGWGTTGWCFLADDITQLTAGRTVTLSVSLCRNGTGAGQVHFPSRQQAAWLLNNGHTHLWASNEQPSSFTAGETVTLQPQQCLRWRTTWHVSTHGRPVPTGDYELQWNTGAALRDPTGHGYHDLSNVHVGPGSSSNGIGPVPARLETAVR